MKLKRKISFTNLALILAGGSFLLLIVILSFYNRFAVDDYYHVNDEQHFGIWGGMLEGYYNWGGRWTSYLLWDIVYHFHESGFVLFLFSFSVMLLFLFSIFLILRKIFEIYDLRETKIGILNYAILFSAFTFFISFGKGEIWFWVQSSAMFIVSIISFNIGISFVLRKGKNLLNIFIIAICFSYAGGASETYALSYFIFLLLILFSFFIIPNNKIISTIKERAFLKIIIALMFLITAFIISIMAPGNAIRATWLPEPSLLNTFFTTLKSLIKLIIFKLSIQTPWIVLFSLPWFYFGFQKGKDQTKNRFKKYLKKFLISIVLLGVLMYLLMFPACYILSEIGPDRSLSLIVISVAAFCAGWSFFIGLRCITSVKYIKSLFNFSMIAIFISILTITIIQYTTVSKYSDALDKRTEYLLDLQKQKNKKTVTVDPLPPSGYLYSAEISSDTNYFGNDHYKRGLFLDFKVKRIATQKPSK